MRITAITSHPYRVPFRRPFATAHGATLAREGIILRLATDAGVVGVGEIAPLPEFGQTLAPALAALPRYSTALIGRDIAELLAAPHEWYRFVTDLAMPATLVCGLEIALLDALGKARGASLGAALHDAAQPPTVPVNAVIGAVDTEGARAAARAAVDAGYTCVKLKVGGVGRDALSEDRYLLAEATRIMRIAAVLPPEVALRLDANEAWTYDQALRVLRLIAPQTHIRYIEQPVARANLPAMCDLRRAQPIPIAADETLTSAQAARMVMQQAAADVLVLKPPIIGGLTACQAIMRQAREHGVRCVITSALESGVGVAAALHLAASAEPPSLAAGLATLDVLEDDLIMEGLYIVSGAMTVPAGPGLGVTLDDAALQRYTL
jgi:o-succinylbenzoate synthase